MAYSSAYSQQGFSFSREEIHDILKAYAAITLAFSILMLGGADFWTASPSELALGLFISAVTVGIGFVLHELGHKFVAQRYGCHAVFRSFDSLFIVAIVSAFFGFIFAVPGAVFISGSVTEERRGRIAAAGPAVNILLALVFVSLGVLLPFPVLRPLLLNGAWLNAYFGFFNMIPFGGFDGLKVLMWNRLAFYLLFGAGLGLLFLTQML